MWICRQGLAFATAPVPCRHRVALNNRGLEQVSEHGGVADTLAAKHGLLHRQIYDLSAGQATRAASTVRRAIGDPPGRGPGGMYVLAPQRGESSRAAPCHAGPVPLPASPVAERVRAEAPAPLPSRLPRTGPKPLPARARLRTACRGFAACFAGGAYRSVGTGQRRSSHGPVCVGGGRGVEGRWPVPGLPSAWAPGPSRSAPPRGCPGPERVSAGAGGTSASEPLLGQEPSSILAGKVERGSLQFLDMGRLAESVPENLLALSEWNW